MIHVRQSVTMPVRVNLPLFCFLFSCPLLLYDDWGCGRSNHSAVFSAGSKLASSYREMTARVARARKGVGCIQLHTKEAAQCFQEKVKSSVIGMSPCSPQRANTTVINVLCFYQISITGKC